MSGFTVSEGKTRADRPPWMAEVFASNMAYRPRSRPNFPCDHRHDVRDALYANRAETLSLWSGRVVAKYLAAARMLDLRDDPVADSLETFKTFDLATMQLAHDVMAAHWRCRIMEPFLQAKNELVGMSDPFHPFLPKRKCIMRQSVTALLAAFRWWLCQRVEHWALDCPVIIRRFCLVLVQQNTAQGIMAEFDLVEALRERYSVPAMMPPS